MGVRDSAASMNSLVAMALFLSASIGTSTKERLKVLASKKVPPGGMTGADMTAVVLTVFVVLVCMCLLVVLVSARQRRQELEEVEGLWELWCGCGTVWCGVVWMFWSGS